MSRKHWLAAYGERIPAEIDAEAYRSVVEMLEEAMKRYAGKPAFRCFGETLTYADTDRLSRAFAAYLQRELGRGKGDRIAVMLPNIPAFPLAMIGIVRAGAAQVNVNPLYTPRELEQQLNDELAAVHLSRTSTTTDSTPEFYAGDTTSSSDCNSSGSSQYPFSSPLGFLQAALPHIPIARLREALEDAGGDMEDVDVESVVEALLTSEYVKELEERGLSGLNPEDQDMGISPSKNTTPPARNSHPVIRQ